MERALDLSRELDATLDAINAGRGVIVSIDETTQRLVWWRYDQAHIRHYRFFRDRVYALGRNRVLGDIPLPEEKPQDVPNKQEPHDAQGNAKVTPEPLPLPPVPEEAIPF